MFLMTKGINESKILTKNISSKCECKFDGRKWNAFQKWNNDKCKCECRNLKKKHDESKKYHVIQWFSDHV